jgi:hypothetical protein
MPADLAIGPTKFERLAEHGEVGVRGRHRFGHHVDRVPQLIGRESHPGHDLGGDVGRLDQRHGGFVGRLFIQRLTELLGGEPALVQLRLQDGDQAVKQDERVGGQLAHHVRLRIDEPRQVDIGRRLDPAQRRVVDLNRPGASLAVGECFHDDFRGREVETDLNSNRTFE